MERKEIYEAIEKKDLNLLRNLEKIDVNVKDKNGDTILNFAIQSKNVDVQIIRLLIEKKGNCNLKDNSIGNTILHNALKNEQITLEIVECLLNEGNADPNILNSKFESIPLLNLCDNKMIGGDLAKKMISVTKNINHSNAKKMNCLHVLCANENPDIVRMSLLINGGCDTNAKNMFGNVPIQLMCSNEHANIQVFKFLAKKTKNFKKIINTKNKQGDSMIDLCVNSVKMNLDFIKYLIKKKAKIDHFENSFLKNLCYNPSLTPSVLSYFLSFPKIKSMINFSDENENTPFKALFENHNTDPNCLKLLIENKAEINQKSESQKYPAFFVAFKKGCEESVLRLLLENKANINFCDNNGNNVLHLISLNFFSNLSFDVILLFLIYKADSSSRNVDGDTPYCCLEKNSNKKEEILFLLKNHQEKISFWNTSNHHLFPLIFKKSTFALILSLKIISKKFNFRIPKPILHLIVKNYSHLILYY
eukprot:TRINITY_DN3093_c0_g1_i1.p1 TRINITY_DN3093_c0_g1~~TRINITY_DN3093_c0_g1_i1.p1  ORF type:complete len:477 (-),score=129.27 TRINITY_DN3093_c0_g1_i1:83-1513(-)